MTPKKSLETLRKEAKEAMGETEEEIPKRISELKLIVKKIDKTICLHPPSFDPFYLRCIRAKKYDLERAAKLYQKFCKLRSDQYSDFLVNLKPSTFSKIFRSNFVNFLSQKEDSGRTVAICQIEKWDPKDISFEQFMLTLFFILDEVVDDEDVQLFGVTVIIDLAGLSLAHVKRIRPSRIHLLVKIFQDSYPCRFLQINFVNHFPIFGMLFRMCSPFLRAKMRERLVFHGSDLNSLHSTLEFDSKYLPKFLGGQVPNDEFGVIEVWEKIERKDAYYEELLKYGYGPMAKQPH